MIYDFLLNDDNVVIHISTLPSEEVFVMRELTQVFIINMN